MSVHIVMDHHGDSRHTFDASNAREVARGKAHFNALTKRGFRAVALGKDGQPGTLLRTFDPKVEEALFIPQFAGG